MNNHAFSRLDGYHSEERAVLPTIRHVTDMYSYRFERLAVLRSRLIFGCPPS